MAYYGSDKGDDRLLLRILLIGKSEVGKTAFMLQYTDNIFVNSNVRTIAVDCRSKPSLTQGKYVKVCIFDPPGIEEFSTITPAYWHFVEAIVFIAAFGDEESLTFIKNMETCIFEEASSTALRLVLVNKCDLKESLGKPAHEFEERIKIWADSRGADMFACSAKENINISEPIEDIVTKFLTLKKIDKDPKMYNKKTRKCKCEIY